jgi:hypothetical protein
MLFGKVKNRFKDAADKSREGFDRVVHEVVDEYEKRKDLSGLIKYRLVRNLKRKWDELKEGVVDRNDEGWR